MKKIKQEKGITLVALIITIVILIILAAVTIANVMHDGFISIAINATQNYASEQWREIDEISKLTDKINEATNNKKTINFTIDGIQLTANEGEKFYNWFCRVALDENWKSEMLGIDGRTANCLFCRNSSAKWS